MSSKEADRDLLFTPAYKLVEMMKTKKLSCVELMEANIRRIKEINPKINAYITVDEEAALNQAKKATEDIYKNKNLGILHGLPISIKDTTETKGIRTTSGSLVLKDYVPENDAIVVERLKKAGAIVVGKTNVPEFANAFSAENNLVEPARNPWDLTRSCSGSTSGGAASVAAGICPMAQGTDGGGSVRAPASFCGVFGIKPTNIINRVPFDPDPQTGRVMGFVSHGPITRNVRDSALFLNAVSGPHPSVYNSIKTTPPDFEKLLDGKRKKLRIAWSPTLGYMDDYGMDPEYLSIVEKTIVTFEDMGYIVEEATPPIGNPIEAWEIIVASLVHSGLGPIYDEFYDKIMIYNKQIVEFARKLSPFDVADAFQDMLKYQIIMGDFFQKYDVLISPSSNSSPQPIGAMFKQPYPPYYKFFHWEFSPATPLFNLTGNPAASCPCGFTSDGLPVGLHIAGKLGDEATVLQLSAALEEAQPWSNKRPSVS